MAQMLFKRPTAAELAATKFDLIVIGGGITGAGVAQDAASRGLRTLLLEKGDFASGTSSKSTKLIHGGLRYLQNMQFLVTLESVREREVQQHLAPHMVWSLPFVIPTYNARRLHNMKLRLGLWLYDLMAAGFSRHDKHQKITAKQVEAFCPGIRTEGLTGGLLYFDCRTDDSRHTLEVVKSACEHGAVALNYVRVTGFVREGGQVVGVEVLDVSPGGTANQSVRLYAKAIVNATGVWMQKVSELGGAHSSVHVVPAKGIHIVVSPERLPLLAAMIIPSVHDRRFCFAVPWYDSILIGTTDSEYEGDLDDLQVGPAEVEYILDALNSLFPQVRLTDKDVLGSYAGLRPLIRDGRKRKSSTADLSRQHRLEESADGLISLAGGKLTTYRCMAKEAVDLVVRKLVIARHVDQVSGCRTAKLMLGGWDSRDNVEQEISRLIHKAFSLGLSWQTARYLPTVYGKRCVDILSLVESDASYKEEISPNHPYIVAQAIYAVRHEAAVSLDDVLSRRIRLAIVDKHAALTAAKKVAAILRQELAWSNEEEDAQVASFISGLH